MFHFRSAEALQYYAFGRPKRYSATSVTVTMNESLSQHMKLGVIFLRSYVTRIQKIIEVYKC